MLGEPLLAAAAAVALTAILAFKEGLHAWLRSLAWSEIRSALLILVATFIVLPFLPRGPIDPLGLLDLRSLWLITITVAAASLGGYVALRVLGDRKGLAVSALVGGLVSSTAVTLDLARRASEKEVTEALAAGGAALATLVSLVRVALLSAAMSINLIERLWPTLAAAALLLGAGAALQMFTQQSAAKTFKFEALRSPLDLVSVGWFAGVLCLLTVTGNLVSGAFGHSGVDAFAATAGLVDVDAVTLAVGKLIPGGLAPGHAAGATGLAILFNQVFKVGAAVLAGSAGFAWRFGLVVLAASAVGGLTFALTPGR